MSLIHAFNVDVAVKIGLEESIILHQFMFWVERSRANEKNFHEGRYWTYNSLTALEKLFPYMSGSTIKRKISTLLQEGILLVGKFHKDATNRSNWYSVDQVRLNQCLGQIDPMSLGQNDPMYNSSNNSSNTVVDNDSLETKTQQHSSEANFEAVYALYPRKEGKKAALRHFQASVRTEQDLKNLYLAVNNYSAYLTANNTELKYTKTASTFFNNWQDWANDQWLKKVVTPAKSTGASGREL
jgi:hypothetical protein